MAYGVVCSSGETRAQLSSLGKPKTRQRTAWPGLIEVGNAITEPF